MNKQGRVLLKDVAKAAGVSAATASLVLNNRRDIHIGEDARGRVMRAAQDLGYMPNRKSEYHKQPDTICFVLGSTHSEHIGTSFFADTADALRRLAVEEGVRITELRFDPSADGPAAVKQALASDPRLFVSAQGGFSSFIAKSDIRVPVITLQGGYSPGEGEYAVFNVDDRAVGRLAAEELNQQNYRKALIIFPQFSGRGAEERLQGFKDAFHGTTKLHTVGDLSPNTTEQFVTTAYPRFISHFDSIYTFSDAMAFGAIRGLLTQGVAIPKEAGVIGTDNLYWSAFSWPSLTTMDLNSEAFARQILNEGKSIIASSQQVPETGGKVVRFPVSLIRRESTARLYT